MSNSILTESHDKHVKQDRNNQNSECGTQVFTFLKQHKKAVTISTKRLTDTSILQKPVCLSLLIIRHEKLKVEKRYVSIRK